jgi:hypothetical protein
MARGRSYYQTSEAVAASMRAQVEKETRELAAKIEREAREAKELAAAQHQAVSKWVIATAKLPDMEGVRRFNAACLHQERMQSVVSQLQFVPTSDELSVVLDGVLAVQSDAQIVTSVVSARVPVTT